MTKLKTLTAVVAILSAIAGPAFAAGPEGGGVIGPGSRDGLTPQPSPIHHHVWLHHRSSLRGAYNQWNGRDDTGLSERDHEPPWLSSANGG
jgi:hypothetical protein